MQSVSSRIWTRVAVSISYDDNHYTTGTFFHKFISLKMNVIARLEFEFAFFDAAYQHEDFDKHIFQNVSFVL